MEQRRQEELTKVQALTTRIDLLEYKIKHAWFNFTIQSLDAQLVKIADKVYTYIHYGNLPIKSIIS